MASDGHRLSAELDKFLNDHDAKLASFVDGHEKKAAQRHDAVKSRLAALEAEDGALRSLRNRLSGIGVRDLSS